MVIRNDVSALRATKDPAGFLRGEARVTRTGVLTYRNADGSVRRELRHPDEVFKADALASFALAPMTLLHPPEAVTSKNAKALSVGAIGAPRADGRFVTAPFAITDDAAISAVEKGMRDLSCGYTCDLEIVSGTFNGESYDAIQRNIRGNHVAIVPRGRAGPEVRIDGDDALSDFENEQRADAAHDEEKTMIKFRIDGVDHEVSESAAQALKVREDRLIGEVAALTKARDDAKTDSEKAKARADQAEAALVTAKADTTAAITARVALATKAAEILGADVKIDALDDDGVKRAVIAKLAPTAKLEGVTADYINARFDACVEAHDGAKGDDAKAKKSQADVRTAAAKADAVDGSPAKAAHAKMVERNRKLWEPATA